MTGALEREYLEAHEYFREEDAGEDDGLDIEVFSEYADQLKFLHRRLSRHFPTQDVDQRFLPQIVSTKGWHSFRAEYPKIGGELGCEREEARRLLRSMRGLAVDTFHNKLDWKPFSPVSIDVLVDKGLRAEYCKLPNNSPGLVDMTNYQVIMNQDLPADIREQSFLAGVLRIFYWMEELESQSESMVGLHTAAGLLPTPLGMEIKYLSKKTIEENPSLVKEVWGRYARFSLL